MSWKKSALVRSYISRLFVNTLTTDDKYSRRNMQNFTQQFEALLSQKKRNVFIFFIAFLKSASNLEHFEKEDDYLRLVISKIIDSKRSGYLNV